MREKQKTSRSIGLLGIPRELRDKIYEELLYLDDLAEFEIKETKKSAKLHLEILRVSRQINGEASKILYEKNSWITVTAYEPLRSAFGFVDSIRQSPAPGGYEASFTRCEGDRLSRSAILDMKIEQDREAAGLEEDGGTAGLNEDGGADAATVVMVIPLAAMSFFCRMLVSSQPTENLTITMRFNHCANESHHSRLLGSLSQARGLRRAVIAGTERPWGAINTVLLMSKKYKSQLEVLDIAFAHKVKSDYESDRGRYLAARNFAHDGVEFLDWWLSDSHNRMRRWEDSNEIFQARADFGFSYSALSLRAGNTELAEKAVRSVLDQLGHRSQHSEGHKARAHYHMAQAFEAKGWRNAALYSYLQALRKRPGYLEADAAVDRMEQHLGSGTTLEYSILKNNIQTVLAPFRHRATGSHGLGKREYKTAFRSFSGTAAEIRSLKKVITWGVVRKPYSNASYVYLTALQVEEIYMDPTYVSGTDDD